MEAVFILIVIFGSIGAMVIAPFWFRERTKQSAHKLISQALEKGQQLDPKMMESLMTAVPAQPKPQDRARKTLGSAIVMIALSAGFVGAAALSGDFDPSGYSGSSILTAALILGALGVGYLILAIVDYSAKKKTDV